MGTKTTLYINMLKSMKPEDWDGYLMKESGLPGPRGNLELAFAFAETADEDTITRYVSMPQNEASNNTPEGFLAMCGVIGLGKLISRGQRGHLRQLREFASDSRWRIRESVAMALQVVGDEDIDFLLQEMEGWSKGNFFEKRAAAAALCEPRLLTSEHIADSVLEILDEITASITNSKGTMEEGFEVLRKGLAYCWSVAVAACPKKGKALMEKWMRRKDKNILWIMKENLKKNRLIKMDKEWVMQQTKGMELSDE